MENALDLNKFTIFSKGIVSKDKKDDSKFISAVPTDYMLRVEGDLDSVVSVGDITKSRTLRCKWLDLGNSSRTTAPDVMIGEQVLIYRYADLEHGYFWTTFGSVDFKLRKLEHIVHEWAGNGDMGPTGVDKRYKLTLSTRDNLVEFQSSKGNGEAKIFNFKLDLEKGVMEVGFENDCGLKLDSNDRRFTMFGAGLTIPDGNLIVGKEALIHGSITGKDTLTISKATKLNATLKVGSSTRIGGSLAVGGGGRFGGGVFCPSGFLHYP